MKKYISKKVIQNPATLTTEAQNNPELISLAQEIVASVQNNGKEVNPKTEQDLIALNSMLRKNPELLDRIKQIATLAQSDGDEISTADAVEAQVIQEVRCLGNEVLCSWAKNAEEKNVEKMRREMPGICQREKKNFGGTPNLEK